MATTDNKAAKGTEIEGLLTLVATEMRKGAIPETVAKAFCDLAYRVQALESIVSENNLGTRTADEIDAASLKVGGVDVKTKQTAKSSPSASSTAIAFIDTLSQDTNGVVTATKKTVRTGSTSLPGVLQLTDSHSSTSTTTAATPKNVKEAYDLANGKYSKPSGGIPKEDLESSVQTSLGKADTALQSHQDISGKQDVSNLVTSIRGASVASDTKYPSELAVRKAFDNDKTYTRLRVEGEYVNSQGGSSTTYRNVGMYNTVGPSGGSVDDPILQPETAAAIGNLAGTLEAIVAHPVDASSWYPYTFGCEDYVVLMGDYALEYPYFQLGNLIYYGVRKFRITFLNLKTTDTAVNVRFCDYQSGGGGEGHHSGVVIYANNAKQPVNYYQVTVPQNRCVTVDVVISVCLGTPIALLSIFNGNS